jgi:hypothetical protein
MYSNVTENLNRPFCGSMANASGFSVAVNELCERAGGHSLHMYPVCRFVRAGTWEIFLLSLLSGVTQQLALRNGNSSTDHCCQPAFCCLYWTFMSKNALEAGIHLMHNREVIVSCENTQIQCTANSRVSYCYSWWNAWLALVTGAVETIYV